MTVSATTIANICYVFEPIACGISLVVIVIFVLQWSRAKHLISALQFQDVICERDLLASVLDVVMVEFAVQEEEQDSSSSVFDNTQLKVKKRPCFMVQKSCCYRRRACARFTLS